ncbi:adenosylmethionine decarboxylase [Amycolatopsis sp. NPDC098790]|uniref:adenosylmethionine decarboxylase n=1 Tax=Amycolatopsis sp. NPDC098790 TaxID=3363939 RepID=UPI00380CB47E
MTNAPVAPVAFTLEENGISFAGTHITIDIWDSDHLDDETIVEKALRRAAKDCGATLLDFFLHKFRPQGITAVAVLGESHISIHAWPEIRYAALDVFTCGSCNPYDAIPALQDAFTPGRIQIVEQKRGICCN